MSLNQVLILCCHKGRLVLKLGLGACYFAIFHLEARLENLRQSCLTAIFLCNSFPCRSYNITINLVASLAWCS